MLLFHTEFKTSTPSSGFSWFKSICLIHFIIISISQRVSYCLWCYTTHSFHTLQFLVSGDIFLYLLSKHLVGFDLKFHMKLLLVCKMSRQIISCVSVQFSLPPPSPLPPYDESHLLQLYLIRTLALLFVLLNQ